MSIDGTFGPAAMAGVSTYPYSVSQRLYPDDFSALVAGTIDHPYLCTANSNGSTPFNVMTGTAYDGERLLGSASTRWCTEQDAAFTPKSIVQAKTMLASGVRSELRQFIS